MRFAVGTTALLAAAFVRADDAASPSADESSSSTSIVKPTFTVGYKAPNSPDGSFADFCRRSPLR
jgi:hypothetical protein